MNSRLEWRPWFIRSFPFPVAPPHVYTAAPLTPPATTFTYLVRANRAASTWSTYKYIHQENTILRVPTFSSTLLIFRGTTANRTKYKYIRFCVGTVGPYLLCPPVIALDDRHIASINLSKTWSCCPFYFTGVYLLITLLLLLRNQLLVEKNATKRWNKKAKSGENWGKTKTKKRH